MELSRYNAGEKRRLFFLICTLGICLGVAHLAQAELIPHSSPNPVGSGARALGMGGAFIAIADDATAASWNPGGLIQLEKPEVSVVGSVQMNRETFDSKDIPDLAGTNFLNRGDLNYASVVYPFSIKKKNFVVSLNYQYMYDLNSSLNFGIMQDISFFHLREKATFRQKGGLSTISPALAVEILPNLSIGATFNIWPGGQGWESRYHAYGIGGIFSVPIRTKITQKDRYSWSTAFNGHLGILWDINQYVTVGAVYKFPFQVSVSHLREFRTSLTYPTQPAFSSSSGHEQKNRVALHMPPSYGAGVAVRFTDKFTVDVDFYRTEWRQAYFRDHKGNKTSFVNGLPMGKGKGKANIDPTHQVRVGAEYLFVFEKTVIPLRAGWFYDPAPSSNIEDKYYGVSIGSGISLGPLVLDAAYQYRFGNRVGKDVFGTELKRTDANVGQHMLLFSAIWHF